MPISRETELAQALAALRARVQHAADAVGRSADEIQILPITKFFPATDVLILRRLGCLEFGESRDQEAVKKSADVAAVLGGEAIRWHMVGHIQRNKARSVAHWAYAAHSVDGAKLVTALDRAAGEALEQGQRDDVLRVYVQLSLDGDESRGGVDIGQPETVDELCAAVDDADSLELTGLMAIPPLDADAAECFARLAAEKERVQKDYDQPLGLSAGMSSDLEIAVEHGSTCVRVGTALLGQRPLTSP